jgi:hypothetical protein
MMRDHQRSADMQESGEVGQGVGMVKVHYVGRPACCSEVARRYRLRPDDSMRGQPHNRYATSWCFRYATIGGTQPTRAGGAHHPDHMPRGGGSFGQPGDHVLEPTHVGRIKLAEMEDIQ